MIALVSHKTCTYKEIDTQDIPHFHKHIRAEKDYMRAENHIACTNLLLTWSGVFLGPWPQIYSCDVSWSFLLLCATSHRWLCDKALKQTLSSDVVLGLEKKTCILRTVTTTAYTFIPKRFASLLYLFTCCCSISLNWNARWNSNIRRVLNVILDANGCCHWKLWCHFWQVHQLLNAGECVFCSNITVTISHKHYFGPATPYSKLCSS